MKLLRELRQLLGAMLISPSGFRMKLAGLLLGAAEVKWSVKITYMNGEEEER